MGKRILLVDDAVFMRMKLKDILEKNGYVQDLGNYIVSKAIEKYKAEKPDLVTMDITMPEMDGVTALKEIKKIDPKAKVIMCSAMGQQSMVMDAIQAGAIDFIVKPFDNDRVIESINKATK